MPKVLHILVVEDEPADVALIRAVLEQEGVLCSVTHAPNRNALELALAAREPDVAILDCVVPDCGALLAIQLIHQAYPNVPCIVVSGVIGEEQAVESLKAGARDFILKNRVGRLPDAVRRVVKEATEAARLKRLEARLHEAQRLEAIGELTGSIAHDFNNQLSAVLGFAELALLELEVEHAAYDHLTKVEFAARTCAELTKRLLAFGRRQILLPQVVSLNAFVEETNRLLRTALPRAIALEVDPGSGVECVKVDVDSMHRVCTNLAINSRDAMLEGGTICLRTRAFDHDPTQPHPLGDLVPELPAGPWAVLSVEDTGVGMSAEVMGRVFEPFFSTKPGPEGSGLGLAMVHGTVLQSGGRVAVESQEEHGTTVSIFLPRLPHSATLTNATTPASHSRIRISKPTETVLVVDDEELVRQFSTLALEQAGYRVLAASDGQEAVELCETYPDVIHAALIDLVMPRLGGVEAAAKILELRPDVKVVYTSGYNKQAATEDEGLPEGVDFLQKPASIARLLSSLRGVLDAE